MRAKKILQFFWYVEIRFLGKGSIYIWDQKFISEKINWTPVEVCCLSADVVDYRRCCCSCKTSRLHNLHGLRWIRLDTLFAPIWNPRLHPPASPMRPYMYVLVIHGQAGR
jgi:hypothetical protein